MPSFMSSKRIRVIVVVATIIVEGANPNVEFVIFVRDGAVADGSHCCLLCSCWAAAAGAARLVRVDPIHRFEVAPGRSIRACRAYETRAHGDRMVADIMDAGAVAM